MFPSLVERHGDSHLAQALLSASTISSLKAKPPVLCQAGRAVYNRSVFIVWNRSPQAYQGDFDKIKRFPCCIALEVLHASKVDQRNGTIYVFHRVWHRLGSGGHILNPGSQPRHSLSMATGQACERFTNLEHEHQ